MNIKTLVYYQFIYWRRFMDKIMNIEYKIIKYKNNQKF